MSRFIFYIYNFGISIFYLIYLLTFPIHYILNRDKALNRLGLKCVKKNIELKKQSKVIWIHAVSGGEVKLAFNLIKKHFKDAYIFLTYMSDSGAKMSEELGKDYSSLTHSYLPFDTIWSMNKLTQRVSPDYLLVIEHDLWMNQLSSLDRLKRTKNVNVKKYYVNFTLKSNEKRFYEHFPWMFDLTFNFDLIFPQEPSDWNWLLRYFPPEQIEYLGNFKISISNTNVNITNKKNKTVTSSSLIITLGSSHEGEEKVFLESLYPLLHYPKYRKNLKLIIVPRHPERAHKVLKLAEKLTGKLAGRDRKITLSSKMNEVSDNYDVLIVDQMGHLENILSESDINLIGDSFVDHGEVNKKGITGRGHNYLESLKFSKATIIGPYYNNLKSITEKMLTKKGIIQVEENNLSDILKELIEEPTLRNKIGKTGFMEYKKMRYDEKKFQKWFS